MLASLEGHDADRSLWTSDTAVDDAAEARDGALRAAIDVALTDKQREVVVAYFFEGASQGDIARRLGISQQVVNKRLFGAAREHKVVGGAIARLRRALTEEPCFAAAKPLSR